MYRALDSCTEADTHAGKLYFTAEKYRNIREYTGKIAEKTLLLVKIDPYLYVRGAPHFFRSALNFNIRWELGSLPARWPPCVFSQVSGTTKIPKGPYLGRQNSANETQWSHNILFVLETGTVDQVSILPRELTRASRFLLSF